MSRDSRVAVVVGNPKPQSRTLTAATYVARELAGREPDLVVDLAELGARLLDWKDPTVAELVAEVGAADLVVVASPTYKATYTGLLKLFLDRFADRRPARRRRPADARRRTRPRARARADPAPGAHRDRRPGAGPRPVRPRLRLRRPGGVRRLARPRPARHRRHPRQQNWSPSRDAPRPHDQPGPRRRAAPGGVRRLPERGGRRGRRGRRRAGRSRGELVHLGEPRARRWCRSRSPTRRRPGRRCAGPRTSASRSWPTTTARSAGSSPGRSTTASTTSRSPRPATARSPSTRAWPASTAPSTARSRRATTRSCCSSCTPSSTPTPRSPLVFHRSGFGRLVERAG